MSDDATLKQFNFLKGKGKWVEGMTKQQAHEAIALIIPAKTAPSVPSQTDDAGAETVPMNPEEKPKKSYELTDGNIRIGALTCAIAFGDKSGIDFWKNVEEFEEYIRNGK